MKKDLKGLWFLLGLSAVILLLWGFRPVNAFQTTVWLSSNTNTQTISTTNICGLDTGATGQRAVLHGVCINTAAAGNVQIFDSSGTATKTITGVFNTATQQPCNFYDVGMSSGISVNKQGNADISILYQCY